MIQTICPTYHLLIPYTSVSWTHAREMEFLDTIKDALANARERHAKDKEGRRWFSCSANRRFDLLRRCRIAGRGESHGRNVESVVYRFLRFRGPETSRTFCSGALVASPRASSDACSLVVQLSETRLQQFPFYEQQLPTPPPDFHRSSVFCAAPTQKRARRSLFSRHRSRQFSRHTH